MRRVRAVSFCVLLVAAACAHAQPLPPIELIDLYGVRTLDEQAVRAALPFREGDAIDGNEDWAAFEREVSAALGVAETRLTLVCCTQSLGSVLYVGIAERPGTHVAYRSVPTGDVELPADVLAVDEAFSAALLEAAAAGDVAEDHAQGHSLARHPALRAAQEKFLRLCARRSRALRPRAARVGERGSPRDRGHDRGVRGRQGVGRARARGRGVRRGRGRAQQRRSGALDRRRVRPRARGGRHRDRLSAVRRSPEFSRAVGPQQGVDAAVLERRGAVAGRARGPRRARFRR